MKKIYFLLLLIFLVSCYTSTDKIEQLKLNMTEAEVINLLGKPYSKEYRSDWNVLKYRYSVRFLQDEYLYVYIENGKVVKWL